MTEEDAVKVELLQGIISLQRPQERTQMALIEMETTSPTVRESAKHILKMIRDEIETAEDEIRALQDQ